MNTGNGYLHGVTLGGLGSNEIEVTVKADGGNRRTTARSVSVVQDQPSAPVERGVGYDSRNGSSLRRRDSATATGASDSFQQSAMMPSGRTNTRPDGS